MAETTQEVNASPREKMLKANIDEQGKHIRWHRVSLKHQIRSHAVLDACCKQTSLLACALLTSSRLRKFRLLIRVDHVRECSSMISVLEHTCDCEVVAAVNPGRFTIGSLVIEVLLLKSRDCDALEIALLQIYRPNAVFFIFWKSGYPRPVT